MDINDAYYTDVEHDFFVSYRNHPGRFVMKSYHYHNVHELYYFISGERRFFFKDRIYHITPGNIIIVKKYELHSMTDWNKPGHSRIMIDFKNDFLNGISIDDFDLFSCFEQDIIVIDPKARHTELAFEKFNNILNEYNGDEIGKQARLKLLLADLLIYLARLQKIYPDKNEVSSPQQKLVSDIMAYINKNYSSNISLQDIADNIGYSRNYLCSSFKKYSHFSISEYLNGVRVKNAQQLLRESDTSITEIGFLCGFQNTTHFGRVFREIAGCSPSQYRKNIRK